jgi:hypothetical protein
MLYALWGDLSIGLGNDRTSLAAVTTSAKRLSCPGPDTHRVRCFAQVRSPLDIASRATSAVCGTAIEFWSGDHAPQSLVSSA